MFRDRRLGQIEDVVADRRRGDVARAAAALRASLKPAAPRADADSNGRESACPRSGRPAHARDARALAAPRRGRVLRPWLIGAARRGRRAALRRLVIIALARDARRRRRSCCPASPRPRTSASRRPRAVPQLARARAARASRASQASSPAPRCRSRPSATRASSQRSTTRRARSRSRSSSCATSFSLATQAYVLGSAASTLAASGRMPAGLLLARPAAARHARADRALPAARGLDHRQPPRRLGRAAGGDVRDRRHRRAVLVAAAFVEVYVSPHVILWLRG